MNTLIKQSKKLVLAIMFVSTAAFAQEKVSDAELGNFAKAIVSIQEISMEAQNTMMEVVNSSGIEFDRFNVLYGAVMMEDETTLASMTADESKKFENIMARFEAMSAVYENRMEAAITKENISIERFEAIAEMMDNDFALQMRLQALMDQ